MITIATNSGATLVLTLALTTTASGQGAAYAGSNTDGHVGAMASKPSLPATVAATDSGLGDSLPWQLRPMTIGNLARVDSAAAVFNDVNGNLDVAVTTLFAASYHLTPQWATTVRLGFVGNNAPGAALDGSAFANPVVGATYARKVGSYKIALFGAATIPLGTGGGDAPSVRAAKANAESMVARPADGAMFAVNHLAAIAGADLAYMSHGFSAQVEATFLQFIRVRGGDSSGTTDQFRTQAAAGLHLGYFIGSYFSLSGDLSYQRWLAHAATTNTVTAAVGPRAHFKLGSQASIRPGIAFVRALDARGFDAPLITAQTTAVQIDIPVTF